MRGFLRARVQDPNKHADSNAMRHVHHHHAAIRYRDFVIPLHAIHRHRASDRCAMASRIVGDFPTTCGIAVTPRTERGYRTITLGQPYS